VARGLEVVDDIPEAAGGHNYDRMAIKVVSELALGDEYDVEEFLDLWVASLGVEENLANEVYQSLDFEGVGLLLPLHH
jgi:putative heme degradation protein